MFSASIVAISPIVYGITFGRWSLSTGVVVELHMFFSVVSLQE